MAIESASDLLVFLDADEFGSTASWTVGATATTNIACIFDEDYLLLNAGDFLAGQEGSQPKIMMRSADIPSGANDGDTVTVTSAQISGGSGSFKVVEIQRDGTGMASIRLQKA